MIGEPRESYTIAPANKFLYAVQTFIDLITKDNNLTYGKGLKALYSISNGADTLNDGDIQAIVAKSQELNLIPSNLYYFMMSCIMKNCKLYGIELAKMIQNRIIDIANGEVSNPQGTLRYSPLDSRRSYYVPSFVFVRRVSKAIEMDTFASRLNGGMPSVSIGDAAQDARMVLYQMEGCQGDISPNESSFGALNKIVTQLVDVLISESNFPDNEADYRIKARAALTILWVIAKMLQGDLNATPQRKDINVVDLDSSLTISDGTLASIPFPTKQTVTAFADEAPGGLSVKGRLYLGAVSTAAFYRNERD